MPKDKPCRTERPENDPSKTEHSTNDVEQRCRYHPVPKLTGPCIKIPVENCNRFFAAINLRIEAAAVEGTFTYHLNLDRQDFIMLSARWFSSTAGAYTRKYHAYEISMYTRWICEENECDNVDQLLNNILSKGGAYLRVRVHASHEFTGFGRAFEKRFYYNSATGKFSCTPV